MLRGDGILRIAVFLGLPNPFPGAAWTRTEFFVNNLTSHGMSVNVYGTFSYREFRKKGCNRRGMIGICNLTPYLSSTNPFIFFLNCIMSLIVSLMILLFRRPNLAVVSVPTGDFGIGAIVACNISGVTYVVDCRDEWEDYALCLGDGGFHQRFYRGIRSIASLLYMKSDLVCATTPGIARSLSHRGVASPEVIWNGADTEAFVPITGIRHQEDFRLLYSGGIGAYYRLDVVLRALEHLLRMGLTRISLTVVGPGNHKLLIKLAQNLGVSDHFQCLGAIEDRRHLAMTIAQANLGIIPYDDNELWINTLPTKFFEYCSCGIPVVAMAMDESLLRKLVVKHQIGVVVQPLDAAGLAQAIYEIHKRKDFLLAAGRRARILVEDEFDRLKAADNFRGLIERTVRTRSPSRRFTSLRGTVV